ncbi:MAG: sensor domain-containing diguanylate cyclase [Bordetella sp.]|uniref:sensor domain-containing diguanylate cyclase n=1 Tax=Bordetella sp. TaxID=28081 RepID=UPI003F7CB864
MKTSAPSIRTRLAWLIVLAILPALAVPALLIWSDYVQARDRTYQSAFDAATQIAAEFDQQLSRQEAVIRALATSPDLDTGNLGSFYQQAQAVVQGSVLEKVILAEPGGKRLLNTLVPLGTQVPGELDAERSFELQHYDDAVVSPVIVGKLTHRPLFSISVPVVRNGKRLYYLTASIDAKALTPLFQKVRARPDWVGSIIDSKGIIAGRSRDAERYVGTPPTDDLRDAIFSRRQGTYEGYTKDKTSVFVAFTHSTKSDWSVAIGVPTEILLREVRRRLLWLVGAMLIVLTSSLMITWQMSERIARAIHGLEAPARALGAGKEVIVPALGLAEADRLGAVLVEAHRMLHSAQSRATTDTLTGLGNRNRFADAILLTKASSDRSGNPFSVLFLDLDRFKPVNDAHGHAVGDEVLSEVGRRIQATLRQSDIAVRLGGDEFAVILPDTLYADAQATARKLAAALAAPYAVNGGDSVTISCSVGVATYPASGNTIDALISAADEEMYREKIRRRKNPEKSDNPVR